MITEKSELDDAISVETVRKVLNGVNHAVSTTFQEKNHFEMTRTNSTLIRIDPPKEGSVTKYYSLGQIIKDNISDEEFNIGTLRGFYQIPDKGIVLLRDQNKAIICSFTGYDAGGRYFEIAFELDFGENKSAGDTLVEQTQKNPLFIKSLMERVFSPDGNPQNTFFKRKMELSPSDYDNKFPYIGTSPFFSLKNKSKVVVKNITSS